MEGQITADRRIVVSKRDFHRAEARQSKSEREDTDQFCAASMLMQEGLFLDGEALPEIERTHHRPCRGFRSTVAVTHHCPASLMPSAALRVKPGRAPGRAERSTG